MHWLREISASCCPGDNSYFPAQNSVFLVTWLMARAKQIPPEAVRRDAAMRVEGLAAILC
jgi:hypothetical protein